MNRLSNESSAYLKAHSDNPVNWYPWSTDSLSLAINEDKPILLSIGYSSCHWCHVMNRESFMNREIAEFMNTHFVSIKIDREERPDLDELYQEVLKQLSGGSGWPLNVFLTPQLKPFYGGTYFGPLPVGDQYSWLQALQFAVYNYKENKDAVTNRADRIINRLSHPSNLPTSNAAKATNLEGLDALLKLYDDEHGGFGRGAKFPNSSALAVLLYHSDRNESAEKALFHTLNAMSRGGIYDHVGGAIFRYTVDKKWSVPHFEKMLYDNALFVKLMAQVCTYRDKTKYRRLVKDTLRFLRQEMKSTEGFYYSSMDADSEGKEGHYYTWTKTEIEEVLGDEAEMFCSFHSITDRGNWEDTNIIYQPYDLWKYADDQKIDRIELRDIFIQNRKTLLLHRKLKLTITVDKKVILGWNALMATALAHSYMALGDATYKKEALALVDKLLKEFYNKDSALHRISYGDHLSGEATLRDYAYLIRALMDVYTISLDVQYINLAYTLTGFVNTNFSQDENPLLRYSLQTDNFLITVLEDIYDEEMPSGNAVMARIFLEIGLIFDNTTFTEKGTEIMNHLTPRIENAPIHHAESLANYTLGATGSIEISIIGAKYQEFATEINKLYLPNKILVAADTPNPSIAMLDKDDSGVETLIYVCKDKSCHLPYDSIQEFKDHL